MKKTVFLILVLLSIFLLSVRIGLNPILERLGYQSRAGLKVTSIPESAVAVNGKEMGMTPFEDDNLPVGEYLVKLTAGKAEWQGKVKLTQGTMAVINRELGENLASSSGEVLSLDKGGGAAITSTPEGATVEIDSQAVGQTPLWISNLAVGEHTFILSRDGYLKRSIKASLPPDLSLNLDVTLAVAETSLESISIPQDEASVRLVVKQTSVGFLRLRDRPSTQGREIGRVSSGEGLTLVEESGGWDKVKTDNGTEGYVSAQYVQKQP